MQYATFVMAGAALIGLYSLAILTLLGMDLTALPFIALPSRRAALPPLRR